MGQLTPEAIEEFFQDYHSFNDRVSSLNADRFKSDFGRLAKAWQPLRYELEKRNRTQARDFNIFNILGVAHDEVNTHSAFLADLLNPSGRHAQGYLFIESFLLMCAEKYENCPLPNGDVTDGNWFVEKEKITMFGNLDLVIFSRSLRYLLVIENKVYAPEQPRQLKRYADWMKTQRHLFTDLMLIYLTPSGMKSSTHDGNRYFRLSYAEDIVTWLADSLPNIEAPGVKEIVQQYLEIIDTL